jgi:hypothetical protein
MTDRLFINDVEIELSPDTVIGMTYQINDLSELKDRQSNFSNQFKIPKTKSNIRALEWSNQVQSTTDKPYIRNAAKVIKGGVQIVPNGIAIIESTDKFFNITVYSGLIDFFEAIKGLKLSDLAGLAVYNHEWSLANILASNANTSGYKYPIINYGQIVNYNRDVDVRYQHPAFFIHTLVDLIFSEALFNKTGSFFSDPNYLKLLLPIAGGVYYNEADFDLLDDWFIGDPLDGIQSIDPLYDAVSVLKINLNDQWTLEVEFEVVVTGWVDGSSVLDVYLMNNILFSTPTVDYSHPDSGGGGGNGTFTISLSVTGTAIGDILEYIEIDIFNCTVQVNDGEFRGTRNDGRPGDFFVHIVPQLLTESAVGGKAHSPKYDLLLTYGISIIEFDQMVLDMGQSELVKAVANLFGLFFTRDIFTNEIRVGSFQEIIDNIPNAKDWSDKLHNDPDTWNIEFRMNKYGQTNWLKYAPDNDDTDIIPGDGNGSFAIDDETLNAETTLINIPFAASSTKTYLGGLYAPIIRTIDSDNNEINTVQRIVIDDTQTITGDPIHYTDGTSTSDETTDIPLSYFKEPTKTFNLGFDDSLIDDYYSGLVDMLQNVKKVTALFKLTVNDIGELDHFIPVYLWQFSSYFYINKIDRFTGKGLTKVEMIRLGGGDVCIPEFGDEILIDETFPTPNLNWIESGDIGVTFTYGIPGVQKDSPGSFAGILTQPFSDQNSPVDLFKAEITITGRTQGSCYVNIGISDGTTRSTNGTFSEILAHVGVLNAFNIYMDADFDGIITSVSLTPQTNCGNESN